MQEASSTDGTQTNDPRWLGYERLPIEIGPLSLRRPSLNDFNDFVELLTDPESFTYEFEEPLRPENVAWLLQQQLTIDVEARDLAVRIAILHRPDWKVIGNVTLTTEDLNRETAQLGICLNKKYWDRRYGALATHAILGFAFARLAKHRIYAIADVRNERCWRMLERVGMRREGHLQKWRRSGDEWIDDYMYAILSDEWNPKMADEIIAEMPPN